MIATGAWLRVCSATFPRNRNISGPVTLYEVADEIALQIGVDNPDHASFFFRGMV